MPGEDGIANRLRAHLPETRRLSRSCAGRTCSCRALFYRLSRKRPELMKKLLRRGVDQSAAARLRRRHPLQARATTPGTSASAWSPTPTSSRRSRDGSAEIVTDRDRAPSPRRGSSSSPGRELEADIVDHRDRPQPALPRRHDDHGRRRGAGPAAGAHLQGDDAERLPQLRLHARLHQRLLDAEGRPHRRIHLPPAQPHGRGRLPHLRRRRSPTRPSPRSRCSTSTPATSCARSTSCPNRARRSRGNCARTTRSTCACCAAARSTTAPCGSPTRRRSSSRLRRLRPESPSLAGREPRRCDRDPAATL